MAGFGSGSQSPASISRTIERIFDEAQHTGEINLSGRKLKKLPSCSNSYDLLDTTAADLSRNKFSEIPEKICEFVSIERLSCYHNVIKCLPRAIVQLQSLVYLNLSRNQLSSLSPCVNQLEELRVLLLSNNRLSSLPDELTELKNLMELDVSCNELSALPNQMCRLTNLKSLNVRKNLLLQLPFGVMQLKLRKLDISSNRIAHIPLDLHKMTTMEELCLDNNPLLTPPSNISTRGLVHIMKYLSNELHPGDKKISQNEVRLRNRTKRSMSLSTTSPENPGLWWNIVGRDKSKQSSADSGYNTTSEGSDKSRWSSTEVSPISPDELNSLPSSRAVDPGNEASLQKSAVTNGRAAIVKSIPVKTTLQIKSTQQPKMSAVETKSAVQSNLTSHVAGDAISMELERQKAEYAARKKKAEELKAMLDADNERRQQLSKEKNRQTGAISHDINLDLELKIDAKRKASTLPPNASTNSMLSFKCDSAVTPNDTNSVNARVLWEQYNVSTKLNPQMEAMSMETSNRIQKLEERLKAEDSILNPPALSKNVRTSKMDSQSKTVIKETAAKASTHSTAATSKSCTSSLDSVPAAGSASVSINVAVASVSTIASFAEPAQKAIEVLEKESKQTELLKLSNGMVSANSSTNEEEFSKELRKIIESKLKIKLPQDVGEALQDGVILCHLANQLRPRSIMCIHIPSPAVPKLSQAKCRRNVDNFLLACRRMGLDQSRMCSSSVILEKRGVIAVTEIVKAMMDNSSKPKQTTAI